MVGRPRKRIDKRIFESLMVRCPDFSMDKIADILECDRNTLGSWCERTYDRNFSAMREYFYSRIQAELSGVIRDEAIKKRNTKILIRYAEKYGVLDKRENQNVNMTVNEGNKIVRHLHLPKGVMEEYESDS